MKLFKKPIFTGFAPNLNKSAISKACGFLFLPWRWKNLRKGNSILQAENWLKNYFKVFYTTTFDSGRSALYFALKALGVKSEDEILVQAYTCVVVSNAITWTDAKPIYVDIDDNFNIDIEDLKRKFTPKAKVLIIQHTFGRPANLEEILKFAKENNLKIIEDCAHSFGAKYNGKLTGTFGDIGMLSFGSDKNVSCVRGGALITDQEDLAKKITELKNNLPLATRIKIIQHLFHYPIFAIGKPLYNYGVGKWLLVLAKKINLTNKIIYSPEKNGKQVKFYPALLPNALANILLNQFDNLEKNTKQRQAVARVYDYKITNKGVIKPTWDNNSVWLRYTMLVENPQDWHIKAKKEGILLGNWYNSVIAPKDIGLKTTGYILGSCPNAEKLAEKSINLPTDPGLDPEDIKRILDLWK